MAFSHPVPRPEAAPWQTAAVICLTTQTRVPDRHSHTLRRTARASPPQLLWRVKGREGKGGGILCIPSMLWAERGCSSSDLSSLIFPGTICPCPSLSHSFHHRLRSGPPCHPLPRPGSCVQALPPVVGSTQSLDGGAGGKGHVWMMHSL